MLTSSCLIFGKPMEKSPAIPGIYTVYPGEYMPLPETEQLLEQTAIPGKDRAAEPPINMEELPASFTIEVAVPGAKREDFLISVQDHIMSIQVLHRKPEMTGEITAKVHEFETECCKRQILLPDHADSEFISAEYRQGILYLQMPKTQGLSKAPYHRIVVY